MEKYLDNSESCNKEELIRMFLGYGPRDVILFDEVTLECEELCIAPTRTIDLVCYSQTIGKGLCLCTVELNSCAIYEQIHAVIGRQL